VALQNGKSKNFGMTRTSRMLCVLASCLPLLLASACSHPQATVAKVWDQKAAASYLDQRETSWMSWPGAARDHETFCVSCHTSAPYALARPALRAALGENALSANERKLLDNVVKRVRLWNEVEPFYTGGGYDAQKGDESRGTEAVVNALILATYDKQNNQLSNDTQSAFDHMWALQETAGENRGAWRWLEFDLEPWEANDSRYYGATLAALAVGGAPGNYRSASEVQHNLGMLRDYLDREYSKQSTLNRVSLLLASADWPELLSQERQDEIVREVLAKQQADGGWKLSSLEWDGWSPLAVLHRWIREDGTPMESNSDGYSTGLVTFALQRAGIPRTNAAVQRGLSWLVRNQSGTSGRWASSSLNKRRDLSSNTGQFMSDAATAFAVLALTESNPR
jgi:squalene-hopene/tetraprenyl-beta-curcumene cyclase